MTITLRPARPADAEEMARWFADFADLTQWGGPEVRFPLTSDQLAAWIAEGANERPRSCHTAVNRTDTPIGHVQFLHDARRRWVRIGRFGVAPRERGKGFGRALFDEAVRIAFDEIGAEEAELAVVPTNERARRLYLGAGFRDEGAASGAWTLNGRPYPMNTMRLKRTDWTRPAATGSSATKVA